MMPSDLNELPLVSVIIPAYNAATTLERTLRSALDQTYPRIEVIVVDDGSLDDTLRLATELSVADARVTVHTQPNAGVAKARNKAIELAKGEYIAALDADDIWHATKLEKQMALMQSLSPRPGFVFSLYRTIDIHDRVLGDSFPWSVQGYALCMNIVSNLVGNGSSLLFSRQTCLEVGGYDASLQQRGAQGCEDLMIQLRIARRYPVAVVPEYLVGYRQSPTMMSSDAGRMARSYAMALQSILMDAPELPERLAHWGYAGFAANTAIGELAKRRARVAFQLAEEAMARDPIGTLYHVGSRASVWLQRTVSRAASSTFHRTPPRRRFEEYSPTEAQSAGLPLLTRFRLQQARAVEADYRRGQKEFDS
jgi:GT2 family glycosyltransferase